MIPSLEGGPTKAKEATSPHEVRMSPLDTNPVFQSLGTRVQSIWEKYSEKLFGRKTHLMVSTFTSFKYRRKYVIPAQLQNLIMQYYAFSGIVFFLLQSFFFFLSHFCFHCLLFVMFPAYLKLVMQRKRIQ